MITLGINIDHVATLRQQRLEDEPNLVDAAKAAIAGGADCITVHLREDRRHIQDQDVIDIRKIAPNLNFEMAVTSEMVDFAARVKPNTCTFVPEKRQELTTEGGLDLFFDPTEIKQAIDYLKQQSISVSAFIDPDLKQVEMAAELGFDEVEFHTGTYAKQYPNYQAELARLVDASKKAHTLNLKVLAGHGIKYYNIKPLLNLPHLAGFNIGHSVISKALFTGLETAVKDLKAILVIVSRDPIRYHK